MTALQSVGPYEPLQGTYYEEVELPKIPIIAIKVSVVIVIS